MKVCVSMGADPFHIGHLRLINWASTYGRVIVILNSDAWLKRKKGFVFMPFEERKEIISNISNVWKVVSVDDSDGTVCEALERIKPDYFANGGDRNKPNPTEDMICRKYEIKQIFSGDKVQSSSKLVREACISLKHLTE